MNSLAFKYKKTFGALWRLTPPFLFYSQCRFVPTCSEYFEDAVTKYGLIKGFLKGSWRILRCNPLHKVCVDEA